jgi:hypothetical protein
MANNAAPVGVDSRDTPGLQSGGGYDGIATANAISAIEIVRITRMRLLL